jgi:hypothetical protein
LESKREKWQNHPEQQTDIIIRYDIKGTHILIVIEILGGMNVIKTEEEKILKYVDLKTEIQPMWNVEAK